MREDGYTLAEALAALFMVGLAIGGLLEGMSVIGRMQGRADVSVREGRSLRLAGRGLSVMLRGSGAFYSSNDAFKGADNQLSFDCAGGARCRAMLSPQGQDVRLTMFRDDTPTSSLVLREAQGARFAFAGDAGRGAVWPPANANTGARQTLRTIDIVRPLPAGDDVLVHTRVWTEQPMQCAYDMIAEACRS
jgi:hypothetical protein